MIRRSFKEIASHYRRNWRELLTLEGWRHLLAGITLLVALWWAHYSLILIDFLLNGGKEPEEDDE